MVKQQGLEHNFVAKIIDGTRRKQIVQRFSIRIEGAQGIVI